MHYVYTQQTWSSESFHLSKLNPILFFHNTIAAHTLGKVNHQSALKYLNIIPRTQHVW